MRTTELKASNEALQAFAYSASHDLRAPLRRMATIAEMLGEDAGLKMGKEAGENVARIQTEVENMRTLVEDMLQLGRAVTTDLNTSEVDLSQLAKDAIGVMQERNPARKVEIDIDEGITASGDPALLTAVIVNLLENAWKYTSRREVAKIGFHASRTRDGTLICRVEDNGVGFDPSTASGRLFRPFQRLHGDPEFRGTGVGLATVRRIIERHGGRIWAEAVPDEGATFHFTLPSERERIAAIPSDPADRRVNVETD